MQAAAGQFYAQQHAVFFQNGVNTDIRGLFGNVRALLARCAKLVDYGVFDTLRDKLGVAQQSIGARRADGKAVRGAHVLQPVDAVGSLVQLLGVGSRHVGQDHNHPVGDPRVHGGAVGGTQIARKVHAGHRLANILCAQRLQFILQQGFKAFGAGGKPGVGGSGGGFG